MQEYQKGKVLVNYWDGAEPVTTQTHYSLDIVKVEPQYVTNINPDPHNNTTSSILPHCSWLQHNIKVTLKLKDMLIPKQGFLIWDDDKWSFCPVRKRSENKNFPIPLNDFINAAPNIVEQKQLLQGWISINKMHELQEIYSASTQGVCRIILANSAEPSDISNFSIRHLLQEDTLESAKHVYTIDISYTVPQKPLKYHHAMPVNNKSIWGMAYEEEYYGLHKDTKTCTYIS